MPRLMAGTVLAVALLGLSAAAHGQTLPEGPGQALVQRTCANCHELRRAISDGYSPQDWQTVVTMMTHIGAKLTPDEATTMVDYLSKNFPEKPKPAPARIDGPVKVEFKDWPVPTPGSRPHDPLADPDGSIWYTAHMASVIGHVDPANGKITEYHPPKAVAGPHGLTFDRNGVIWFTENFAGQIGRFDPKTAKFTEYPLPDPKARDPHTPLFDKNGILWFTVQSANMVGRLDPASGEIKLVTSPTPKSNPYGMVINSKGVPFFDEFGTNKIGSIDPQSMKITEYPLPDPQTRPRRIAITPDDIIWYTDYARGYLGRLDPKTGAVREIPSPSGPESRPYAISVARGALWYVESNTRPNTLVRFDLKSEKFQTFPIPSGGGVVRNMMTTADGGHLVTAESAINRVGLVTIK